ncbi:TIGR04282 family arsenosugar biosynthesis glycosyltransferase [Terasakiella sp. A23]|uniref:TIGR04282 family arsenosugar biosynthesis glycosyltransferase n=1 Tax=Terasakiella sp. FCG-A23 TaxID=3080561 RepID=UPI00295477F7|nr:TIGR04282 family arsenosugar biosynthesis glycosyltransferase [Terasakiella sp. A23]MDV7338280.1 TIGR04282 family arsenosugar biosynthesis glycosyltransferase [Terasakiella sp. A23]
MTLHLVIFAKEPRIGRVKTRLARDIGKVPAWRFYRRMVHEMPRKLRRKGPWKTWISHSPDRMKPGLLSTQADGYLKQGSGDLGERMFRPASTLPPGPFLVIGTDVPGIRAHHIRKAFKLLGTHDVVFGPADDGGFWLVGLKRHGILANPYRRPVRWSHAETLNDCLANLEDKKVAFLDMLEDVDDGSSFLRWRENR